MLLKSYLNKYSQSIKPQNSSNENLKPHTGTGEMAQRVRGLAVEAWGPVFRSSTHRRSQVQCYPPVTPALELGMVKQRSLQPTGDQPSSKVSGMRLEKNTSMKCTPETVHFKKVKMVNFVFYILPQVIIIILGRWKQSHSRSLQDTNWGQPGL